MDKLALQKHFREISAEVQKCAKSTGRPEKSVLLLAVSKQVDVDAVQALYDIGVRDFGENREPELARKKNALPKDIRWHFIGRLQSNKIRKVVKNADVIHSADSIELLERINRIAGEEQRKLQVLIEISVAGEEQKGGIPLTEIDRAVDVAAACKNIDFSGFMTMAPLLADEQQLKEIFETMYKIKICQQKRLNRELPILSMGMSRDFRFAITAGATIVRLGTTIFFPEKG